MAHATAVGPKNREWITMKEAVGKRLSVARRNNRSAVPTRTMDTRERRSQAGTVP